MSLLSYKDEVQHGIASLFGIAVQRVRNRPTIGERPGDVCDDRALGSIEFGDSEAGLTDLEFIVETAGAVVVLEATVLDGLIERSDRGGRLR